MIRRLAILVILLSIVPLTYSQDNYKIVSRNDSIIMSNEAGIKINRLLLDRKRCYEDLNNEETTKGKDSINNYYELLVNRMNSTDSLHRITVVQFSKLLDIKNDKYDSLKDSFKQIKKQGRKNIGIGIAIGLGLLIPTLIGIKFIK